MEFLSNINIQFYLAAYLIGAIPFGLLLAKLFAGVNIKEAGSRSIGATNVLRVVKAQNPKLAKRLGIATLILDAMKGLSVIAVAKMAGVGVDVQWTIGVLAVLGHCYSPYLGFEGGKGVATGLGVVLILLPLEAIIGLAVWFVVAKQLKVSSLASLAGLLGAVAASFLLHPGLGLGGHGPLMLIALLILYKHIPNIVRLVRKEEQSVA